MALKERKNVGCAISSSVRKILNNVLFVDERYVRINYSNTRELRACESELKIRKFVKNFEEQENVLNRKEILKHDFVLSTLPQCENVSNYLPNLFRKEYSSDCSILKVHEHCTKCKRCCSRDKRNGLFSKRIKEPFVVSSFCSLDSNKTNIRNQLCLVLEQKCNQTIENVLTKNQLLKWVLQQDSECLAEINQKSSESIFSYDSTFVSSAENSENLKSHNRIENNIIRNSKIGKSVDKNSKNKMYYERSIFRCYSDGSLSKNLVEEASIAAEIVNNIRTDCCSNYKAVAKSKERFDVEISKPKLYSLEVETSISMDQFNEVKPKYSYEHLKLDKCKHLPNCDGKSNGNIKSYDSSFESITQNDENMKSRKHIENINCLIKNIRSSKSVNMDSNNKCHHERGFLSRYSDGSLSKNLIEEASNAAEMENNNRTDSCSNYKAVDKSKERFHVEMSKPKLYSLEVETSIWMDEHLKLAKCKHLPNCDGKSNGNIKSYDSSFESITQNDENLKSRKHIENNNCIIKNIKSSKSVNMDSKNKFHHERGSLSRYSDGSLSKNLIEEASNAADMENNNRTDSCSNYKAVDKSKERFHVEMSKPKLYSLEVETSIWMDEHLKLDKCKHLPNCDGKSNGNIKSYDSSFESITQNDENLKSRKHIENNNCLIKNIKSSKSVNMDSKNKLYPEQSILSRYSDGSLSKNLNQEASNAEEMVNKNQTDSFSNYKTVAKSKERFDVEISKLKLYSLEVETSIWMDQFNEVKPKYSYEHLTSFKSKHLANCERKSNTNILSCDSSFASITQNGENLQDRKHIENISCLIKNIKSSKSVNMDSKNKFYHERGILSRHSDGSLSKNLIEEAAKAEEMVNNSRTKEMFHVKISKPKLYSIEVETPIWLNQFNEAKPTYSYEHLTSTKCKYLPDCETIYYPKQISKNLKKRNTFNDLIIYCASCCSIFLKMDRNSQTSKMCVNGMSKSVITLHSDGHNANLLHCMSNFSSESSSPAQVPFLGNHDLNGKSSKNFDYVKRKYVNKSQRDSINTITAADIQFNNEQLQFSLEEDQYFLPMKYNDCCALSVLLNSLDFKKRLVSHMDKDETSLNNRKLYSKCDFLLHPVFEQPKNEIQENNNLKQCSLVNSCSLILNTDINSRGELLFNVNSNVTEKAMVQEKLNHSDLVVSRSLQNHLSINSLDRCNQVIDIKAFKTKDLPKAVLTKKKSCIRKIYAVKSSINNTFGRKININWNSTPNLLDRQQWFNFKPRVINSTKSNLEITKKETIKNNDLFSENFKYLRNLNKLNMPSDSEVSSSIKTQINSFRISPLCDQTREYNRKKYCNYCAESCNSMRSKSLKSLNADTALSVFRYKNCHFNQSSTSISNMQEDTNTQSKYGCTSGEPLALLLKEDHILKKTMNSEYSYDVDNIISKLDITKKSNEYVIYKIYSTATLNEMTKDAALISSYTLKSYDDNICTDTKLSQRKSENFKVFKQSLLSLQNTYSSNFGGVDIMYKGSRQSSKLPSSKFTQITNEQLTSISELFLKISVEESSCQTL